MRTNSSQRSVAKRRRFRIATALLAAATTTALLAACTGPKSSSANSTSGGGDNATLTVSFIGPPLAGMNPAKTGGSTSSIYNFPAYDSLTWLAPDGSVKPFLALSWKYVDDAHKVLQMKLRKDIKFSDGTPFNAAAVKKYLEYYKGAGGHLAPKMAGLDHVEVVDSHTVRIHMTKADPELPRVLAQVSGAGSIVSPKALDDPSSLDNSTAGVGPYIYDPKQSVVNDHYVYVKNPHYWNPDAIKFAKVDVRVITDANSVLSAVRSGQVDVATGNADVAGAAKKAGIRVLTSPGGVTAMILGDRDGTLVKPLGDVRVRQALNYAIDQDKLTKVLNPSGLAEPAHELIAKGLPGYSEKAAHTYSYDPAKAKKLLAEAGYPDGFTLPATCPVQMGGQCQMLEAMASQFAKVGVKLKIDSISNTPAFNEKVVSGKVAVLVFGFGTTAYSAISDAVNSPTINPLKSTDPQITEWYTQLGSASQSQQQELYDKIIQRLRDLAWFIPVYVGDAVYFASDSVANVELKPANLVWDPFSPIPSKAWKPAK